MLSRNELIDLCKENGMDFEKTSQEWKDSPDSTYMKDNRGERNPMYGKKQSEESKRKNGLKTKERFNDPDFRQKHSDAVKASMKNVPKEKLAYKNRKKNKEITCCLCGRKETVYSSQTVYWSKCKKKYSKWRLTKMRKELSENVC